jgi:hypothetical protein
MINFVASHGSEFHSRESWSCMKDECSVGHDSSSCCSRSVAAVDLDFATHVRVADIDGRICGALHTNKGSCSSVGAPKWRRNPRMG